MPRTRPAGVRRTATGVVSGVGGAGSGERIWVACSECFTFEQPAPSGQTAKASKKSETDARFVPNPNRRARTDFVARRAATMTEFDGGRMFEHRKSLKFNGESTQPLMVWRLILSVPKKSAGMGVPAWGGVEGFPPLFFPAPFQGISGLSVRGEVAGPRRPHPRRSARAIPGSCAPRRSST